MFPPIKGENRQIPRQGVIRVDQGTMMVPGPEAGRRVMAHQAVAGSEIIDKPAMLALAADVLRAEADAIVQLSEILDDSVVRAARLLADCTGVTHITGVGKAGLVGQKFAATAASFGIRAFFLHPVEAAHGDLGRVSPGDLVIALSQSGESEEVLRIATAIRRMDVTMVALTSRPTSPLAQLASLTVALGDVEEACPLGLAPTTSTTVMMACCDVLAILAARFRGVLPEHFAANHPAGKLGRRLAGVDQIMRTGRHIRLATKDEIVREVLLRLGGARRRSGAIMIVDEAQGVLRGIFTDSDLVRLLERGRDQMLDRPIGESMTVNPTKIYSSATVAEAVDALRARKLSELPVVDDLGRPVGMIDVTDLIGLVPIDLEEEPR